LRRAQGVHRAGDAVPRGARPCRDRWYAAAKGGRAVIPGRTSRLLMPLKRWLDQPEPPMPSRSPSRWLVRLLQVADPIELPIGRKERLFLRVRYAPSRRRLPRPRGVLLAPCLLLAGGTIAIATFTGWRLPRCDTARQITSQTLQYVRPDGRSHTSRTDGCSTGTRATPSAEYLPTRVTCSSPRCLGTVRLAQTAGRGNP
jgi:hypothetical protein